MQKARRVCSGKAWMLCRPSALRITISPGSTSRTNRAWTWSKATVSLASAQPSPTRPMDDGHVADERVQVVAVKNLRHQSHADVLAELPAVAGDDARAFLAAMLQGIKPVIGQLGGVRVAVNAKDPAVMFGVRLHALFHRSRDAIPPEVVQFRQAPSQLADRGLDLQLGTADR